MDEKKEIIPQSPVPDQSTSLQEDAKNAESKEKEEMLNSLEQKASELSQPKTLSNKVSKDEEKDFGGTSHDKSCQQQNQFLTKLSSSDKDVESVVKTVVDIVSKERDEKDHGFPQTDVKRPDKKVIEQVYEGVADMKLIEQHEKVDTPKTIDREKPPIMCETTEVKIEARNNYANNSEKKDNETVEITPMDVDLPKSVHEQVKSDADVKVEQSKENPIKNGELDNKEEEMFKNDDWDFPPSDSEDGNFSSEPPPHVIIELCEKLAKEEVLDLEWTCLGRRSPEEETHEMEVEDASKDSHEEMDSKPVEEDPTEFDFDIDSMIQNEMTPRRVAVFDQGQGGSGSAKKRVAQWDRVINNCIRFNKIDEEMVKTGDAVPPTPTDLEVTPQRPLGKFHIRRDLHQ